MNDNFLNKVGLGYYHNRIKTQFADKSEVQDVADDLEALSDRVDDIIAEGGEPNVIEVVKVNNSALTPDANKAVNIDLSGYAETSDVPTKTSDLTNDGDGTSNFATESYVDTNGGKIDKIKVNNVEQTITNKTVNIDLSSYAQTSDIPTKTSDLTNDSNFQTDTEVEEAIDAKLGSTYKPKGSVAFANLPSATKANEGNVYNITDEFTTTADFVEGAGKKYPAGTNVVIINTSGSTYKYDVLSGFVDLSNYWNSTNLVAITTAEIDQITA